MRLTTLALLFASLPFAAFSDDRVKKLSIYAREQVRHTWLVDPLARTLEVLRLENARWSISELRPMRYSCVDVKNAPAMSAPITTMATTRPAITNANIERRRIAPTSQVSLSFGSACHARRE